MIHHYLSIAIRLGLYYLITSRVST